LLHVNARPHTGARTQALIITSFGWEQALITSFGWEQFHQPPPPPFSPDLSPSDFHLFLRLKKFLAGQRFLNDDDVKEAVKKWLSSQAATFYEEGIQKLVPHYDKCLNNGGNCRNVVQCMANRIKTF
jgi:histone-lysine N-methyltransferase SETMAR